MKHCLQVCFKEPSQNGPKKNHIKYCKALYDFDGKNSSELSFKAGDVIKVVRTKTPRGGDDGWWEGEAGGGAGLFPSLVVEPLLDTAPAPAARPDTAQHKLEIVEMESGAREPGLSKVSSLVSRSCLYPCPCPSLCLP